MGTERYADPWRYPGSGEQWIHRESREPLTPGSPAHFRLVPCSTIGLRSGKYAASLRAKPGPGCVQPQRVYSPGPTRACPSPQPPTPPQAAPSPPRPSPFPSGRLSLGQYALEGKGQRAWWRPRVHVSKWQVRAAGGWVRAGEGPCHVPRSCVPFPQMCPAGVRACLLVLGLYAGLCVGACKLEPRAHVGGHRLCQTVTVLYCGR